MLSRAEQIEIREKNQRILRLAAQHDKVDVAEVIIQLLDDLDELFEWAQRIPNVVKAMKDRENLEARGCQFWREWRQSKLQIEKQAKYLFSTLDDLEDFMESIVFNAGKDRKACEYWKKRCEKAENENNKLNEIARRAAKKTIEEQKVTL